MSKIDDPYCSRQHEFTSALIKGVDDGDPASIEKFQNIVLRMTINRCRRRGLLDNEAVREYAFEQAITAAVVLMIETGFEVTPEDLLEKLRTSLDADVKREVGRHRRRVYGTVRIDGARRRTPVDPIARERDALRVLCERGALRMFLSVLNVTLAELELIEPDMAAICRGITSGRRRYSGLAHERQALLALRGLLIRQCRDQAAQMGRDDGYDLRVTADFLSRRGGAPRNLARGLDGCSWIYLMLDDLDT